MDPRVPEASWPTARRALAFALVAASVLLALGPALGGGFVYDDRLVVLRNPAVAGADLGALLLRPLWSFYSPKAGAQVGYWRPLSSLALAGVYRAAGPEPAAFHALSLALHVAACAAAWALARRLSRSDAVGAAAALLFGLHPVHVESAAWISAVGDPLSGLLALLALERHAAWRERGSQGSPWAAGALILLALLAKELAAGAILAAVALDLALGRKLLSARAWLPWALAVALYWLARAFVFHSALAGLDRTTTDFGVAPLRLALLRGEILGGALQLLLWPRDLRLFHPFVPDAAHAGLLAPLLLLLAWAGLCAWLARRGERLLLAAALLAVVPLLALVARVTALGIFPLSERYLYLPVFGLALALALLALRCLPRAAAVASVLAVGAAWGVLAHAQARTWHDEETLLRAAAERSPRAPYARRQLGRVLLERFRATRDAEALSEAGREFQAALDLLEAAQKGDGSIFGVRDDHVQANVGLGWVLLYRAEAEGLRDFGPAASVFRLVVERYPDSEEGWTGLGVAELARHDLDAAQQALERALQVNERFVEARRNLGRLWMERGEWVRAREQFEAALRWQPDNPDSLLLLGAALERGGDDDAARRAFDRAAAVAPRDARPLVQRAILLAKHGDLEAATRELDRALELDPRSADALLERGKVHAARGEKHAALESFQRACDLDPDSFEAHYDAGALLLELQGAPQAMPYLIRAYERRPAGPVGRAISDAIRAQPLASPEVCVLLATADADRDEVDSALAWIEDALRLDARNGKALYLKGGMLERKGDHSGARAAWEQAAEALPGNFEVHDSLAGLLMRLGEREAAIRHLEEALKILERAAAQDPALAQPLHALRARVAELKSGR